MSTVYRVIARVGGSIGDADTMDGVIELAKNAQPGRYRIDKMTFDPVTGDLRTWESGVIIKDRMGGIKIDLPPWFDS